MSWFRYLERAVGLADLRVLIGWIGLLGFTASGWAAEEDWLPRFLEQLDPASPVGQQIAELGPEAARPAIIATAAGYFRSREPLVPLWEVPIEAVATDEDISRADLAIDHVITERSGVYHLPEKLPWFDAPKTFYTLSRFPHLDYLMRAYLSTGDERYATAMVRDLLDFVENVPLSKAEGYHVQVPAIYNPWNWVILQVRVRRWIDSLAHLRASPSLSDEDYLRIVSHLWAEVDWVVPRKILGLHNGTLGNASTILYASLQYPEAKSAAFWQSDSTALLDGFLDMAFYPGEFLVELTLGYSEGTLMMCRKMYESLPPSPAKDRITPKLEALFDAHVGMMKPDRGLPLYGDNGIYDISERVLRKGAELFGREDWGRLANDPTVRERADGFLSFPYESNPYYLSGYYAMRDGWQTDAQYLSMDAGPFGTNHQHADKLSITVSADGAPFIVDPGTSIYISEEPGPRHDLRLGFLHNVITIDGIDPNTGWDRHYAFDVLENRWVTNRVYDFLEGTYEYRNNLLNAMWRRSVMYIKGDYWIVLDAIYGEGEHEVESNLQFGIGNQVVVNGRRATSTAPNGATLDLVSAVGTELKPEVLIGDDHFPGTTFLRQYPNFVDWQVGGRGWVGALGNFTPLDRRKNYPAPALLRSGRVTFPFKTVTVLTPSIDQSAREAKVKVLEESENRFILEISNEAGRKDTLRWELADWPDHDTKIADDSGWWVREEDRRITQLILLNRRKVVAPIGDETLTIEFEDAFEGRIDRTATGWTITADDYYANPPRLIRFTQTVGDRVVAYALKGEPLQPNEPRELMEVP
ncbi:MAG: hypothetical protein SynsKO_29290 [Synoicihabitans sp.]